MTRPCILFLEDNATDVQLTQRTLVRGGVEADFVVAQSREEYVSALERSRIDVVISDTSIPGLPPLGALELAGNRHPQSSFIILSGSADQRMASLAREAGAVDWLTKSELPRLVPIVNRVLDRGNLLRVALDEIEHDNTELLRNSRAAQRLVTAVKELSAARDVPTIQAIVRRAARELNGADGATFVLREGDLCHYADEDAITPLWKGQRFPMSTCISGWAMLHRRPAVVEDIAYDSRIPLDAYRPTFVRSLVMVPIRTEAPIGAIGNYWAKPHTATEEEIALIQALADSTSIALENVQVYQELEQRVSSRTAELKEANRALEEFSYFASHDLRAPLRHIHAFSDILRQDAGESLSAESLHALDRIKAAAMTMGELLEGLLDLAYSGQQELRVAPLDMTGLVKMAVELARDKAVAAEFRIGTLAPAKGDKILLRQVWTNLVGNAAKYSSASAAPVVEIGSVEADGEVRYFVRDNGVGFDMAEASKLFAAFRRLETGKGFAGSGVGLAIVHRIVTRHGGRIWAESARGQGATFYFTLGPAT
jgi:signal transduction histidine kinase